MTQLEEMMDFLDKHGSITGMQCIEMGIMNYKGRVADLRKLGVDIETSMESYTNSQGKKKTFARYILRRA